MTGRAQDKRTWLIGGAVGAVVIAAAAWFFGISPVTDDTDSLRAQTDNVQQQNVVAQHNLAKLASTKSRIGSLQHELVAALVALPIENGLPNFTRQLSAEASALHLTLKSVTVGSFTPANVGGTTGATSGESGTDSGTAGSTPAPTGTTAPAADSGTSSTVAIGVTVTSFGSVVDQLAFVRVLRAVGPRRALVTQVTLEDVAKSKTAAAGYNMTTQLTIFATPKTAAERALLRQLLSQK